MTSAINPLYPVEGTPTTESVRDNFAAAKTEIEALQTDKQDTLVSGVTIKTIAGKNPLGSDNLAITKEDVGLPNVDNTSDMNKPVSTAQEGAIMTAAGSALTAANTYTDDELAAHVAAPNPHAQYGLVEYDADDKAKGFKNLDGTPANILEPTNGLVTEYWGPCTGRSSLPKASGSWKYTYGYVGQFITKGGNKFRGVVALIFGPAERMRAIAEGTTNGFGDIKASLIWNGVAYPGVVVDSVNRFFDVEQPALTVGGDPRIGRCPYGNILSMEFDLGDVQIPDNALVFYKIASSQTPHNDATAVGAGQYMVYGSRVLGQDVFAYAVNTLSAPNWASWLADVDSPTPPASLPGQNGNFIGMMFHSLYSLTTERSEVVLGDSRNHGPSNEATANYDIGLDAYGLTGEIPNIIGMDRGLANVAIQTEKITDITTTFFPNGFIGRGKISRMCTDGSCAYGYNDLGDSPFSSELTVVSAYQSNFDVIRNSILPSIVKWKLSTIAPAVSSTDYITTVANQNPLRSPTLVEALNGAIRKNIILGAQGYYDPAAAVGPRALGFIMEVPPGAKTVNTGTGTITVNAATGSLPAITTLDVSIANTFTKDMEGYYGVIPGVGASAGVLRFQIQWVDGDTCRMIVRDSEGAALPILASMLNGNVTTLAVTFSANPLYIGAEELTADSPTAAIHANVRSYRRMRRYNKAMGLA